MEFTTAIFDLDGTLLNTLGDLADATRTALCACGFPALTDDEVRRRVGNGIRKLIERSVPEGTDEETTERCLASFQEAYMAHLTRRTVPYDGIPAVLTALRQNGVALAVVTNKIDHAANALMEHFFGALSIPTYGDAPTHPRKPNPTAALSAMHSLGGEQTHTAFIGDSSVDIATAKNAGFYAVGVSWGFRDTADLAGADAIVQTPAELYSLLTGKKL